MNRGDGLASGAKSASFTTTEKRMTKEEWAAMFEPEVPAKEEEKQEAPQQETTRT
jgi:hypothetical protein